jgi:pSer/pThr/pTyr-binding forkhead associated (FHA) protein
MIYKDMSSILEVEKNLPDTVSPFLKIHDINNDEDSTIVDLTKRRVLIGRSKACDIRLDDLLVSSKHFLLWWDKNEWHIKDLNSKNGTLLNGERIDEPYLLDDGDRIRAGEFELEFKTHLNKKQNA